MSRDTIFALSSAPGPAGVAVVRVSGPGSATVLRSLAGRVPEPRRATVSRLHQPGTTELLDRGLILWFPGPASATGEDVAEFHVHGGRAVVRALLEGLGSVPGTRPAAPGEFTRRAFLNGKLDLTQVEGLADLVQAETEGQRRQASRQMEGELGRMLEGWRAEVLRALAHVEAAIDFAEDEVPGNVVAGAAQRIQRLMPQMERCVGGAGRAERLRTGVHVAILGPPNAGKSSLLNALAKRDAAIVASTPGTTRDVVEVHLDLGGVPVVVADTAGLREATDEIEGEGVRRALARAASADLRVGVFDVTTLPDLDPTTLRAIGPGGLVVLNKIDVQSVSGALLGDRETWNLSAKTGAGVRPFVHALQVAVVACAGATEEPGLTRARHRNAMGDCLDSLRRFLEGGDPGLRAEDLRIAAGALGRVTGRIDVEEVLDVVFREFCIGK